MCSVLNEEEELTSFVLDTRNISFGSGVLAVWAAQKLEEGMPYEELVRLLPGKVQDSNCHLYTSRCV